MNGLGIIGKKVGMTRLFDENDRMVPVTVIQAGPCSVVQVKASETDGYAAVQLGFEEKKLKGTSNPQRGHFRRAKVSPKRTLREFRLDNASGYECGVEVKVADLFEAGQLVDIVGTCKGRGFTGAMKRHNFNGQGASHGNEKKHRVVGSIGSSSDPSRVLPGKRMPGQYGNTRTTVRNLKIVKIDRENNLLVVSGSVPGPNGGIVIVKKNKYKRITRSK